MLGHAYHGNMTTETASENVVVNFIARWQASGAAERANYQLFLTELCDVLGVANPEPVCGRGNFIEQTFIYPLTRAV